MDVSCLAPVFWKVGYCIFKKTTTCFLHFLKCQKVKQPKNTFPQGHSSLELRHCCRLSDLPLYLATVPATPHYPLGPLCSFISPPCPGRHLHQELLVLHIWGLGQIDVAYLSVIGYLKRKGPFSTTLFEPPGCELWKNKTKGHSSLRTLLPPKGPPRASQHPGHCFKWDRYPQRSDTLQVWVNLSAAPREQCYASAAKGLWDPWRERGPQCAVQRITPRASLPWRHSGSLGVAIPAVLLTHSKRVIRSPRHPTVLSAAGDSGSTERTLRAFMTSGWRWLHSSVVWSAFIRGTLSPLVPTAVCVVFL